MSEQNKAIAREFLETAWHKRDMNALGNYVAADHVNHGPFSDQLPSGLEGAVAFAHSFVSAFPDVHFHLDKQEADGDMVTTWVTYHGTQTGQLMNIPPTGKHAVVPVKITDRIVDGKIVESWAEWDPQDMMRQLGVG